MTPASARARIHGFDLHVGDLERSIAFYVRLGLRVLQQAKAGDTTEVLLRDTMGDGAEATLVLIGGMRPARHPWGRVIVEVDDIHLLVDELRQMGHDVCDTVSVPDRGLTFALTHDPDGHPIELVQLDVAQATSFGHVQP